MKDRPNRNTGWACLESYLEASTAGDGLVRDNADSVGHGCSPNTSYSKATPSGSFSANQASAASWLAKTLREEIRGTTRVSSGARARLLMREQLKWHDEKADNSPWINALAELRQRATREGHCFQHVQAITVAIDQYAEKALGNRDFFLNKPYGVG